MKIGWVKISLMFFLIVASIGTLLRGIAYISLPLSYGNLVHAHSHVAFQGWIYTLLFLFITKLYLTEKQIQQGNYTLLFKLTVFIIIGVLISFTAQGYGLYSIICSTLFQFLVYWFTFRFLTDIKNPHSEAKKAISIRFVKVGLWLGILSSLVPFAIGALSAKGLQGTEAYQSLVYTFLHLQYNGWFLFMGLGLFFKCMEKETIDYNGKWASHFFWLFAISVVPAISLSLLGMNFRYIMILPAVLSAILQVLGLFYLFLLVRMPIINWISDKTIWFKLFITIALASFFLKVILQLLSVFPQLESFAFNNKNIILAYLHLNLIGVISFLLLAFVFEMKWIQLTKLSKMGSAFLIVGFTITELILVAQGIGYAHLSVFLFMGSALMALGILLLVVSPSKSNLNLLN